jgi:hypothetical protein
LSDEPLSGKDVLREGGSILKDAILNQYQAILALGAGALSAVAVSPLPLLVWLGAELVLLPLIDTPPVRRLVHRRRMERQRQERLAWRRQAVASLSHDRRTRFQQMESLCSQIEANYLGLNGISRIYLTEQRQKLDDILNSCLHRMLALGAYEKTLASRHPEHLEHEIERFERDLSDPELPARARAALEKNIELKQTLLKSLRDADGTRRALETELDSSYAVLEVLLQNSLSMRDPDAISAELDAIVQQAQESERAVREMETLMRGGASDFGATAGDRVAYSDLADGRGVTAPTADSAPRDGATPASSRRRTKTR